MSFIDWGLSGATPANQNLQAQATEQQLNTLQQRRAVSAMQGVNISDPASVNNALQGLLSAGAIDQAKGLTDLAQTRGINTSVLPAIQNAGALATLKTGQALAAAQGQQAPPTQQSSDQQQPDLDAAHRQILQQGADAVNDLLSYDDPNLRAAAAAIYRQKFAKMGIPQQNVDEVLGDLSDTGLKAHEAFLTAAAQGNTAVPHPTGFAASQALLNSDPIYRNAQGELTGPMADATVQGILSKYGGIDLAPGFARDLEVTAPARAQAAQAAFAGTTSEASARGTAVGGGSVGTPPIAGARLDPATGNWILPPGTTGAIAAGAAAQTGGATSETPATIKGPGGEDVHGFWQTQNGQRVFTEAPMAAGASTRGPTIAGAVGQQAGASAAVQAATDFENYSNGYRMRKANLDNLRQAAGDISTGPQAPFWGRLGALAAEYGIKTGITPTTDQTAAYEEVQKMAQSVLAQQKDALGLPNTNQSVSLATGATPHESTSPLGLQRLSGVLEGNEDYINATRQAWESWKGAGNGKQTYQEFVPQFMKLFDPRVFQAQYLDAAAQAKVRQSVGPQRFDQEVAAARRLGYLGQ